MDADEFVLMNIGDQITAFQGVAERMRDRMSDLDDDEKSEIEEASRILRKVRAASSPTMLGMPTLPSQRGETA